MPRYISHDYVCQSCGHGFYTVVEFDKRDEVDCPQCASNAMRVMSVVKVLQHRNTSASTQRGAHADLSEALKLKEQVARKGDSMTSEDKDKIKKEYKKLKGEEMKL